MDRDMFADRLAAHIRAGAGVRDAVDATLAEWWDSGDHNISAMAGVTGYSRNTVAAALGRRGINVKEDRAMALLHQTATEQAGAAFGSWIAAGETPEDRGRRLRRLHRITSRGGDAHTADERAAARIRRNTELGNLAREIGEAALTSGAPTVSPELLASLLVTRAEPGALNEHARDNADLVLVAAMEWLHEHGIVLADPGEGDNDQD